MNKSKRINTSLLLVIEGQSVTPFSASGFN